MLILHVQGESVDIDEVVIKTNSTKHELDVYECVYSLLGFSLSLRFCISKVGNCLVLQHLEQYELALDMRSITAKPISLLLIVIISKVEEFAYNLEQL